MYIISVLDILDILPKDTGDRLAWNLKDVVDPKRRILALDIYRFPR